MCASHRPYMRRAKTSPLWLQPQACGVDQAGYRCQSLTRAGASGSRVGGPKMPLQRAVVRCPVLLDRPVQRRLLPRRERLHCQRVLDTVHHAAPIHPHALDRPWRVHAVLPAPGSAGDAAGRSGWFCYPAGPVLTRVGSAVCSQLEGQKIAPAEHATPRPTEGRSRQSNANSTQQGQKGTDCLSTLC